MLREIFYALTYSSVRTIDIKNIVIEMTLEYGGKLFSLLFFIKLFFYCMLNKKAPFNFEGGALAGAIGIEPTQWESEAQVLPLHQAPSQCILYSMRVCLANVFWRKVNRFVKRKCFLMQNLLYC